jgi:hypothetical protein
VSSVQVAAGPALADDFFRLSHNDVTGHPRLTAKATGLGLAAALLADLILAQRLTVHDEHLHVSDRTPPADALSHTILDQVVAEPHPLPVRTWLDYLSLTAVEQVAHRLHLHRQVRPEKTRRHLVGRITVVWVPTDMNIAAWPWARLSTQLGRTELLSDRDAFLACLAVATGLDRFLLERAPSAAHDYVRQLMTSIHPVARSLICHTQAAVGDSVMAYRS